MQLTLTSLLTAAGLAVSTTNAFLLPFPDGALDDTVTTLPVPAAPDAAHPKLAALVHDADARHVLVPCPGCRPRVRGSHKLEAMPPRLELNFTIAHGPESDRLLANGFQLYPQPEAAAVLNNPFTARVIHAAHPDRPGKKRPEHKDGRHHHHGHHAKRLAFSWHTKKVAHSSTDDLDLLEAHLDVLQVGRAAVQLPTVELRLIRTPAGGLMIGDVTLKVFEMPSKIEDCTSFFCRWRMTVLQAFRRLRLGKPCHGEAPAHSGVGSGSVRVSGGLHHHNPPHMHHGHRASWGQLLKNIGAHILLPVAIGIVAGVAASVLGMMFGTVVVFLWRTFFRPANRRHHRRHSCHKAAKVEVAAATEDEKSGLMAGQDLEEIDAPPAYADDKKPEAEA